MKDTIELQCIVFTTAFHKTRVTMSPVCRAALVSATPAGLPQLLIHAGTRSARALTVLTGCRCVSPVLIVVAAMTHGRSVFVSPPDKRAEAAAARAQLTANSTAAKSDHLAIIAAFNAWTAAWTKGGRQQAHLVLIYSAAPSCRHSKGVVRLESCWASRSIVVLL